MIAEIFVAAAPAVQMLFLLIRYPLRSEDWKWGWWRRIPLPQKLIRYELFACAAVSVLNIIPWSLKYGNKNKPYGDQYSWSYWKSSPGFFAAELSLRLIVALVNALRYGIGLRMATLAWNHSRYRAYLTTILALPLFLAAGAAEAIWSSSFVAVVYLKLPTRCLYGSVVAYRFWSGQPQPLDNYERSASYYVLLYMWGGVLLIPLVSIATFGLNPQLMDLISFSIIMFSWVFWNYGMVQAMGRNFDSRFQLPHLREPLIGSANHAARSDSFSSAHVSLPQVSALTIPFHRLHLEIAPFANGSYGRIYKGTYGVVPVAAKQLFLEQGRLSRDAENEIKVLLTLRHPNIVQFLGVSVKESFLYIVTELADSTLKREVEARSYDRQAQFVDLCCGICEGLRFLHENGVAHQDLKPSNILIQRGHPVLCDLGLSKICPRIDDATQVMTMTIKGGTPNYQAPEIYLQHHANFGSPIYDPRRCDIYSLGLVFVFLWTTIEPFSDLNIHMYDLLHKVAVLGARPPIVPPDSCAPVMPPSLSTLIVSMWDGEPARRPKIAAVLEVLDKVQEELGAE